MLFVFDSPQPIVYEANGNTFLSSTSYLSTQGYALRNIRSQRAKEFFEDHASVMRLVSKTKTLFQKKLGVKLRRYNWLYFILEKYIWLEIDRKLVMEARDLRRKHKLLFDCSRSPNPLAFHILSGFVSRSLGVSWRFDGLNRFRVPDKTCWDAFLSLPCCVVPAAVQPLNIYLDRPLISASNTSFLNAITLIILTKISSSRLRRFGIWEGFLVGSLLVAGTFISRTLRSWSRVVPSIVGDGSTWSNCKSSNSWPRGLCGLHPRVSIRLFWTSSSVDRRHIAGSLYQNPEELDHRSDDPPMELPLEAFKEIPLRGLGLGYWGWSELFCKCESYDRASGHTYWGL